MSQRVQRSEFERLPKSVQRVISTVRQGETLCKFLRRKETGETDVRFFFEPSGRKVGRISATRATRTPFLAPQQDGLFAGTDQTWTAAT